MFLARNCIWYKLSNNIATETNIVYFLVFGQYLWYLKELLTDQ